MLWQLQILPCSSRSAIQWSIHIWNTLQTCSLLDSISFEWFVHLFLSVSLAPPFSLCVPFCVFPRRHDATLALHLNIVGPLAMEVAFSLQVRNILYLLRASMIFAIYSRSLFVSIIQTLLYPISFQTVIFLLPFPCRYTHFYLNVHLQQMWLDACDRLCENPRQDERTCH